MKKLLFISIILIFTYTLNYGQNLQWHEVGRMPIPVKGHRAVVVDSVIWIIGGYSDSLNSSVNFVQEFNPLTNTWRVIGNTRFLRKNFCANVIGDSVLIYGGEIKSSIRDQFYSLEIYKRSSPAYIIRYHPVFNRKHSASLLYDYRLILVGGEKSFKHNDMYPLRYLVEYDLENDSVIYFINNFPYPSSSSENPYYQSLSILNGNVFIFGGVLKGVLNSIYRYNLSTKNLTRVPINLLAPRAGAEAIKFNENSIIIIGGFNEVNKALRTTEIFEFNGQSVSISQGPMLINPRSEFAAVRFRNSIYVFGGENQFEQIVPSVEKLDLSTNIEINTHEKPSEFSLEQNYPNPFNPSTTIFFKIPQNSKVLLEIFDILGQKIKTLVNEELQAGYYFLQWDGTDDQKSSVPSGVYFYRIQMNKQFITRKMQLIR